VDLDGGLQRTDFPGQAGHQRRCELHAELALVIDDRGRQILGGDGVLQRFAVEADCRTEGVVERHERKAEAKEKAKEEANKIVSNAMTDIENQKKIAITEVKNELGALAISIAEKVIKKELKGNAEQEAFVNTLVKDIHLN